MTLQWTQAALAQARGIEALVEQQSPQGAQELIERIFDRVQRLEMMPRSGSIVAERNDPNLREVFERSYRIIYRIISDDLIEITAVVHASQQIRRL